MRARVTGFRQQNGVFIEFQIWAMRRITDGFYWMLNNSSCRPQFKLRVKSTIAALMTRMELFFFFCFAIDGCCWCFFVWWYGIVYVNFFRQSIYRLRIGIRCVLNAHLNVSSRNFWPHLAFLFTYFATIESSVKNQYPLLTPQNWSTMDYERTNFRIHVC